MMHDDAHRAVGRSACESQRGFKKTQQARPPTCSIDRSIDPVRREIDTILSCVHAMHSLLQTAHGVIALGDAQEHGEKNIILRDGLDEEKGKRTEKRREKK